MAERIMKGLSMACLPVIAWLLISWADVVVNSHEGLVHAWNFFMVVFGG